MRKRLWVLGLGLVLLFGALVGTAAAAGGADDPLVSVSYLYHTFLTRLQGIFEKETGDGLVALAEDYSARLDALQLPEESQWDRADGFISLSMEDGGSVRMAPFGTFLLTTGVAKLHIYTGQVIDLSEGRVCSEGEVLIQNHRYFTAEESEALVRVYSSGSACYVDGAYLAESTGDFDISEQFLDLEKHWSRSQVVTLAEAGLVNGMDAHHFEPNRKVTRAMFVTVLGRMYGLREDFVAPISFTDVKEGDWFAPYVTWASLNGIVNGYEDGTFGPNREITREQMAVILIRYCEAYDYLLPEEAKTSSFTDEALISSWALEAVQKTRRWGLINGRENGSFDPRGTATRAEMCAVIARLMEKLEELKNGANTDSGENQPVG